MARDLPSGGADPTAGQGDRAGHGRLAALRALPAPFLYAVLGGLAVSIAAWFFPLDGVVHSTLWAVGCGMFIGGATFMVGFRRGVEIVVTKMEISTMLAFTRWAEDVLSDDDIDMDDDRRQRLQADYHRAQKRLKELS